MVTALVYLVFGLIESLIAIRFILLLLGANISSEFVSWIYAWSQPFVAPFANIFGQHTTVAGPGVVTASVFDWTALIALIVYGLVGWALSRVLAGITP